MAGFQRKTGLGKGLGALLEDTSEVMAPRNSQNTGDLPPVNQKVSSSISEIKVAFIETNPFQPRTEFDEASLQELAASIQVHGLIQPITVRKMNATSYQLISGERRLRASKLAGLEQIPAYIRTADDQQMLEMGLIENIQREDLNPLETALSFQRMIDECQLKQEELGDRVGKSRPYVTNCLRILRLPPDIQKALKNIEITMGHAKAILGVEQPDLQLHVFKQIVKNGLNVRQAEELVKGLKEPKTGKNTSKKEGLSFQFQKIQDDLTSKFSTQVKLKRTDNGKGSIEIPFLSDDDLTRILDMLEW